MVEVLDSDVGDLVDLEWALGVGATIATMLGIFYKIVKSHESLKLKVDVLWKIFEEQLPKLLVRPTHIVMDELIEKYVAHEASLEEMEELSGMMQKELEEGTDAMAKLKISFIKPVLDHNISQAKK